ncbi:hypothetical protein AAFF_G00249170 [Aldrovandia affinis]|uniref:Specifically androgen-regulated gene protein n=1 Tax=Aldrovandia affinis TaxID=143900 RepID=A0AAD7RD17_9TELE|nr:hypothetical protein AAFF_G00249170 [Aldrovandia affinis]
MFNLNNILCTGSETGSLLLSANQRRPEKCGSRPFPCAMPKSDTWPGGVAMESMTSMDSAGSCDSMVSVNSGFSDDSLEHLSAEERECLLFLEETIESLEVEEDSGLSNDEHDDLPVPGSLAAKMADLSSSMGQGRLDEVSKYPYDDPVTELGMDHKPFSYLVPTPLVLANSGSNTLPKTGTVAEPLPTISNCLTDLPQTGLHGRASPAGGPPRGQDTLVQGGIAQDDPKTSPPAVAPKPKRLPSNIILKTHKSPISSPVSSPDPAASHACLSPSERVMMDPQKVRMEALRKLGLLKEDEVNSGPAHSPLHSPKFHRFTPSESPTSTDPPQSDTAKTLHSPAKAPAEPKSCGGYRERSRSELLAVLRPPPANPKGGKSTTLERSGSADGSSSTGHAPLASDRIRDFRAMQSDAPQKSPATAAAEKAIELGDGVRSHKLPRSQGISVLITPHSKSGEERREALRKLGLLKD